MRKNHFLLFLLSVFVGLSQQLAAQSNEKYIQENYIHYTLESGLPTGMVYNCVQDKNGFIWFGSFAGLIRFDGHDFFTFTIKQGLPDNEIISTSIDSMGRVWAYSFSKNPIYIYQNQVHSGKNDSLLNKIESVGGLIKFHPAKQGGMWLKGVDRKGQTLLYYYGKSQLNSYQIPKSYKPIVTNYIDTFLQVICKDSIIYPQKMTQNHPSTFISFGKSYQLYVDYYEDGFYLLLNAENECVVKKYKNDLITKTPFLVKEITLPKKIMCSYYHADKLYIAFRAGGYITIDSAFTALDTSKIQLKEVYIGGIVADNQGSIWFATMGDGIYCLPSHPIYKLKYQEKWNKMITQSIFKDIDGELFMGNSGGEIQRFTAQFAFTKKIQIGTGQYNRILHIEKSIFYPQDLYIVCDEGFFIWHDYKKHSNKVERIVQQSTKCVYQSILQKKIFIGTSGFLNEYNPETGNVMERVKKRITAFCETGNGELFFCSSDGLYKIAANEVKYLAATNPRLNCRAVELLPYQASGIWIATSSEGLLLLRNDSIIKEIGKNEGLTSDMITTLYQDAKGHLWVGTNKGLNKIVFDNGTLDKMRISTYSIQNGLIDNTINGVTLRNDSVFVVTYKGFCVFKDFNETHSPHINMYITGVSINSRDTISQEDYFLPFYKNTLSISFTGICLSCNEEIYYYYRLLGKQNDWQMTHQKQVEFGALSPGEYTFEVYAMNENNPVRRIHFLINPPWWQTNWAIAFIIVATLLSLSFLGFFFFSLYRKRIQKKYQEEKHIKELEIQALRAQMNPHFIFNCLSSIQYFVNSGEIDSANVYMDKFAKLIRKTLHFSQNAVNSVEDEISYIDNYLQLEQMRFEDLFQYEIEIDEKIDTEDVFLPSLILQPFVENAIRHGLRFKSGKGGKLWIRFYEKAHFLICEIEDNGIGRKKSAEIKSKQHIEYQSQGMMLSQNRLLLFNTSKLEKMKMEVVDLSDEKGQARGTLIRVSITLDF